MAQVGLQLTDVFLLHLPSAGPSAESVRTTSPAWDSTAYLLIRVTGIPAFCFDTRAVDALLWLQSFGPHLTDVPPPTELASILTPNEAMNIRAKTLGSNHRI